MTKVRLIQWRERIYAMTDETNIMIEFIVDKLPMRTAKQSGQNFGLHEDDKDQPRMCTHPWGLAPRLDSEP